LPAFFLFEASRVSVHRKGNAEIVSAKSALRMTFMLD
jgi:hypothetical protein